MVTASRPFVNIPNYPDEQALMDELKALPHVAMMDIEEVAKENSIHKCANIILLGMAARYVEILNPDQLRESIRRVFAAKGEKIVEMNLKAFDLGLNA